MWEIYAYQNSDSLFGILNAVAAIAGANNFKGALAVVAFCGFVSAVIAYAVAPQKLQGWQWLASVTLVLSVLFVPRVTVGIVDKTGSSAVAVVDNVPFGLAVFGSLSSTVGNTLTELYETAMQLLPGRANLPVELSYQKNGLLFGNRLIREASRVVFQDPTFRTDLIAFINNCTMYDLASGDISPELFAISGDVWPMMANPNPARFTPISDASGTPTVTPCPQAYQALNSRLPAQVNRIQALLAQRMNPTLPGTVAATLIAGQVQQAYIRNGIANAAASAADLIRQNALINAVNDTSLLAGQRINDPASMLLAVGRAQAVAQTNAAWLNNGKLAEQALPVIRNTIEAIVYAIFPIVVLLLLMTGGRETMMGLKNYASVLIWIQLWPPLYAILNYMAMVHAARELEAAASVGGGVSALSLMTSSSIYSGAISGEAVVGYLTMSIPVIAWAGLKRMETFGSALIGGIPAFQSLIGSTTAPAASGNVGLGNTTMDQVTVTPMRSSPFFAGRQHDASGNTYTRNVMNGLSAVKALANEGPVSRIVDTKVSQQHVMAANSAVSAARSESISATQDKATALSEVLVNASTRTFSHNASSGKVSASSESEGERIGELQQIARNVSKATGATEQQVAAVAFGGSAHLGGGIPSAASKISPVDAGAQISATGRKTYSASIQQQDQLITNALTSEDKAKFKAFSDTVTKNTGMVDSLVSDSRIGHDLSAKLARTVSRSERADANLKRQTEFSETISGAYQRGESITKDVAKDPRNIEMFEDLLRLERAGSAAELVKMESYIGNMATVPHHLTGNSNLPIGFHDVEGTHIRNVGRLPADNINGQFKADSAQVRNAKTAGEPVGSKTDSAPISSIRSEIAKTGRDANESVRKAEDDFYKRSGVELDKDGHIYTHRSLFGDANEQVRSDPDIVAEKAKELALRLAKMAEKGR